MFLFLLRETSLVTRPVILGPIAIATANTFTLTIIKGANCNHNGTYNPLYYGANRNHDGRFLPTILRGPVAITTAGNLTDLEDRSVQGWVSSPSVWFQIIDVGNLSTAIIVGYFVY